MTKKLESRYKLNSEITLNYSPFVSHEVRLFKGYDDLHKRDVLIKTFDLPKNKNTKRLAISL
ncbi:MAG: hypothetical protein ACFFC7_17120 [Candidatus Hermodarchaeota archaeon]